MNQRHSAWRMIARFCRIERADHLDLRIIANARIVADYYPKVLVLYLERLRATVRVGTRFGRALLIQRLEGSRPQGSLCTLNRSEQVQRDQAQTELGSVG